MPAERARHVVWLCVAVGRNAVADYNHLLTSLNHRLCCWTSQVAPFIHLSTCILHVPSMYTLLTIKRGVVSKLDYII